MAPESIEEVISRQWAFIWLVAAYALGAISVLVLDIYFTKRKG